MSTQLDRLTWWQNFTTFTTWEANGANVFYFDTAISFSAGDWLKFHQWVETQRQAGKDVRVIRRLAKYLVPDKLDATFDATWVAKGHIYAFSVGDEEEDKQKNADGSPANIYSTPQPIVDYFAAATAEVAAECPGIPVIANFNGTHINASTLPIYKKIVDGMIAAAKGAVVCIGADSYPDANQQVNATGQFLYPDMIAEAVNGATLLRAAYPASTGVKIHAFVDTCNQMLFAAGAPGWSAGWKAVGSRSWTPAELTTINSKLIALGVNSIAYFPQQKGGTVVDATDPALIPVIRQIAGLPATPPVPTPPAPPAPAPKLPPITVSAPGYASATLQPL
jgi:hypothetical protein